MIALLYNSFSVKVILNIYNAIFEINFATKILIEKRFLINDFELIEKEVFLRFEEFRVFLIEKVLYLSLDRLCVFMLIFVQRLLLFVTV